MKFLISVIIPCFNEQAYLVDLLPRLRQVSGVETIVVDGGSEDYSADLASVLADRLLITAKGRGIQMNAGAQIASGDILLFLHADSILPPEWHNLITDVMLNSNTVGGAFDIRLDNNGMAFRLISIIASLRSRLLKTPYGDQGIFVRNEVFHDLGGFKTIPIMEDAEFSRRLCSKGNIAFIPQPITTSSRKWQTYGFFRTTAAHWLVTIGYYLEISPQHLKTLHNNIISKH